MPIKFQGYFSKKNWPAVLLGLVLMVGLIIRVNHFDYTLLADDPNRDYLIGHHILAFQEYPKLGPRIGPVADTKNSPIYFYLVAGILSIHDDPIFLNLVNLILLLSIGGMVFILGSLMFNSWVGLTAAILHTFSHISLKYTNFIWQSNLMSVLINLSFVLFGLAYFKKRLWILYLAIFIYLISGLIHISAFAIAPAVLVAIILTLRKLQLSRSQHLQLGLYITLLAAVFLLPTALLNYRMPSSGESENLILLSKTADIPGNLYARFAEMVNLFFVLEGNQFLSWSHGALIMFIVGLGIAILSYDQSFKNRLGFLLSVISLPALLLSITTLNYIDDVSYFYSSVLGLISILVAAIVGHMFPRWLMPLIVLWLVVVISPYLSYYFTFQDNLFRPRRVESALVDSIKHSAAEIKGINAFNRFDFFQIKSVTSNYIYWVEAPFWVILERDLGQKMIMVDDNHWRSYRQINQDQFVYLVCGGFESELSANSDCLGWFLKRNSHYLYQKTIYQGPEGVVYLTQKQSF